jgi:hypothetical protein
MVKTMGKADVDSKQEKTEKPEPKSEPARRPARPAKKGAMPLEIKLCWVTLGAAGLLMLVFVLDLIAGIPFGKASIALDILVLIAAGILAYLSWDTIRELQ